MRSILAVALVFTLAFVSVAQAQQVVVPAPAEPVPSSLVEVVPHGISADAAGVQVVAAESRSETVAAPAARETSARNVLALLGAVVVVVALIAFLR
jgi:hypothetical protein